ncbi:MAG TPA: glycosyltransferase [Cytophagaceae bacterium]|jgi:GT2 family glycosyltransferase|nr:glycosyltransferase [Cytophagaceae bacterium]
MKTFSISVVIPNYNGKKLLEKNIPGVINSLKKSKQDYEIIVSDDASSDDSVLFLRNRYPSIVIIENKINQGFASTINKGIRSASKDLVLALNSDVNLTEDYFLPQLRFFEDPGTFGVMGRIIGVNDDSIQDGAKYPIMNGFTIKGTINYILKEKNQSNISLPSFYLSGANALMDRKKLQELGGFDEIYSPFYGEDLDLSIRAWRLGWKCFYEHEAVCRHPASTTIASYHKKQKIKIIATRNKLILHSIHLEGFLFILYKIKILFELIFRTLTFQTYFLRAFILYLKKPAEITSSKTRLSELIKKYSGKNVEKVISLLQAEINKTEIIKF